MYDGGSDAKRHSSPAIVQRIDKDGADERPRLFLPEQSRSRESVTECADFPFPASVARASRTFSTKAKRTSQQRPWSRLSPLREGFRQERSEREVEDARRDSYRSSQALPDDTWRRSKRFSNSRPFSPMQTTPARRYSRLSQFSHRLSRPLSFNGSIWMKDPEDICVAFQIGDADSVLESEGPFDPPHHVFSRGKKKRLVYLVSLAAMFSPLSSNIYFPALDTIAKVLHTPIPLVSLTITIYMLFQGVAPSFWGPLADVYGRRPILLSTLIVYILANIGLALTPSFAVLMAFRGVQAVGSSATIAIGAGVIGDMATGAERGGFIGLFGGIRMFGQAIGPVFGGALSQYLGFRSIFYFLFGLASVVVILLLLFLPETLRKIAGNGSRPLYGIYKPIIGAQKPEPAGEEVERHKLEKVSFATLLESFKLLAEKDVLVNLVFGGIVYAVWSMITSSTSTLFKEEYHLNDVLVGLAFLPNGLGCVLGSLLTGTILDRDYEREAVAFREANSLPPTTELRQHLYPDFPLEKARLKNVYLLNLVFVAATAVYGFSVEWFIGVPLALQFLTAFTATAIFNINSTLIIDLYPSKPASATAINNLVRCTLGAIGVGLIEKGISAVEEAPMFLTLASIALVSTVLVMLGRFKGPCWRMERLERIKQQTEVEAGHR